jgi:hypothetical protein
LKLIVAAVVGAMATVLVSWACSLWAAPRSQTGGRAAQLAWPGSTPASWPNQPHAATISNQFGRTYLAGWWEREDQPGPQLEDGPVLLTSHGFRSGVPFRALSNVFNH